MIKCKTPKSFSTLVFELYVFVLPNLKQSIHRFTPYHYWTMWVSFCPLLCVLKSMENTYFVDKSWTQIFPKPAFFLNPLIGSWSQDKQIWNLHVRYFYVPPIYVSMNVLCENFIFISVNIKILRFGKTHPVPKTSQF